MESSSRTNLATGIKLDQLPIEILFLIFNNLDAISLNALRSTTYRMQKLIDEYILHKIDVKICQNDLHSVVFKIIYEFMDIVIESEAKKIDFLMNYHGIHYGNICCEMENFNVVADVMLILLMSTNKNLSKPVADIANTFFHYSIFKLTKEYIKPEYTKYTVCLNNDLDFVFEEDHKDDLDIPKAFRLATMFLQKIDVNWTRKKDMFTMGTMEQYNKSIISIKLSGPLEVLKLIHENSDYKNIARVLNIVVMDKDQNITFKYCFEKYSVRLQQKKVITYYFNSFGQVKSAIF
ncbi:uncharacterized protein LOC119683168 [Teleopsis dalmanni]|uniref:uncharacterized protein LOC119683168 n=1 Tax=Teleopsis dalmanni TaxID=139649 RepID=UPI0018CDA800|nr:uncharacterized protein LOC119683168 [Teleopsis dalmanni]